MLIRAARRGDAVRLSRVGARSWQDAYGAHFTAAQIERGLAQWWTPGQLLAEIEGGLVLIAEDDEIVGLASGDRRDVETWVVWKLYVVPERRSEGIGRLLLAEYLTRLPRSVTAVVLEHFAFNVGAAAFYEREGFDVDGTAIGELGAVVWRRKRWSGVTANRPGRRFRP
jgi:GNAT superfamily N-acetyltransferase